MILNWAGKDGTSEFDKFHSTSFLSTFLPPSAYIGPAEVSEQEKCSYSSPFLTYPVALPASAVAPSTVVEGNWVKPPLSTMLNLFDFEYVASRCMDHEGWSYYSSGADDEITLRENHAGTFIIFIYTFTSDFPVLFFAFL